MASTKFQRGQIWEVDLEPQSHKEEPGKRKVRRDKDYFPLRVALPMQEGLPLDTDLLIDQVRAISNRRFVGDEPLTSLNTAQLKRVEDALKLLIGR